MGGSCVGGDGCSWPSWGWWWCLGGAGLTYVLLLRPRPSPTKSWPAPSPAEQYQAHSPSCFQAPATPGDRRRDKSRLKVVNFNAEWLFLYGGRGNIRCPADSCPWTNMVSAAFHLAAVANLLATIDADVVHLTEVEGCRVLKALLESMPGKGHNYIPYLIDGKDHATGQNVALLTRVDPKTDLVRTDRRGHYPIAGSTCAITRPGTIGSTKHYAARVDIANGRGQVIPFLFVGLHLLARPTDKTRCAQREGQAMVLRDLVRSLSTGNERIVMMGDYNDYDGEALGPDGERPLTQALRVLYDSSGSHRPLANAAKLIPASERYTCWFGRKQGGRAGNRGKVMIDHILYDASLEVEKAEVHNGDPAAGDQRVSDHWPFSVTFKL